MRLLYRLAFSPAKRLQDGLDVKPASRRVPIDYFTMRGASPFRLAIHIRLTMHLNAYIPHSLVSTKSPQPSLSTLLHVLPRGKDLGCARSRHGMLSCIPQAPYPLETSARSSRHPVAKPSIAYHHARHPLVQSNGCSWLLVGSGRRRKQTD